MEDEAARMEALGKRFLQGMELKRNGALDDAEDVYRAITRIEPRLAEPHMELAHILLETDRLGEAEEHAREALEHLRRGGPWTDDLPAKTVESMCHALVAEVLRRRADEDDVIFGDPAVFKKMVDDAKHHFEEAARLDPSDATASYYATFMGVPGVVLDALDEEP